MNSSYACDVCAVRKIKCDGGSPCASCLTSRFNCTRLRRRMKSGPKGPRQRTKHAINQIQQVGQGSQDKRNPNAEDLWGDKTANDKHSSHTTLDQEASALPRVSLSSFRIYLNIYHYRLYVVWPVIERELLLDRLATSKDPVAYSLATAVCAATMAQLQFHADGIHAGPVTFSVHHSTMAMEATAARDSFDYMDHPTLDTLLTSFFLHVYYANIGKYWKSTLLLREAIACAHVIGLHKSSYYEGLEYSNIQPHLRIAWLLFITDRAHTIQNDLPATFKLSPNLPPLRPEENPALLPAFCSLCKLFQSFDETGSTELGAQHADALTAMRNQLRQINTLPRFSNELQRADIFVTEPWLQIVLWKKIVPYVNLTIEPDGHDLSASFPVTIAKTLLSRLSTMSLETLDAHGPGMGSKLFEVASSVADLIICVPQIAQVAPIEVGPRDVLHRFATLIGSLRGSGDPTFRGLLQEKMAACGIENPMPGRITEITEDISSGLLNETNSGDSASEDSDKMRFAMRMSPMPETFPVSFNGPEVPSGEMVMSMPTEALSSMSLQRFDGWSNSLPLQVEGFTEAWTATQDGNFASFNDVSQTFGQL